ncbi:MAG: methyltransferase [Chloroflexi bacterium]|nr:methyltransferase [Chloroflexota bacterium]
MRTDLLGSSEGDGSGALDETVLRQRHEIRQMATGFRQAQILLTCFELGVFEALNARPATSGEVATAVGADTRGVDLLLNAAAALGLVQKREGLFANTALAATCLTSGGPGAMGGTLRLQRASYRRWGRLADAVRSGQRPEEDRRDEQADDWVRNFVYGLYEAAQPVAPFVAGALDLPADRPLRVIDVGGCHAAYSLALARRYPLLTATVFELPAVVLFAREIIDRAGLADRVSVQAGDFQQEGLGHGYDIALVFGVLNGEPPDGRPALIRKVYDCLDPGGHIVLRDFVLDPDRAGPPEAAIFALQMLLATESGGLDTSDDWASWLAEAGFEHIRTVELPAPADATLTVAQKPER